MDDKSSKTTDPSDQLTETKDTRRAILTALLGGIGVTALTGCLAKTGGESGDSEQVGAVSEALTGTTTFIWVDALGVSGVANLRAAAGAAGTVAFLEGYSTDFDGGGGLFYWSTTAAIDDGGTILNSNGLGGAAIAGWRRFYEGALDIRWFGAQVGFSDSLAGIQAAVNAAFKLPHGGEVYFPPGQFSVSSTILIPRSYTNGITLRGAGSVISELSLWPGQPATTAVLAFDTTATDTKYFRLEGLQIDRPDPGYVFLYAQHAGSRFAHSTIRDVFFLCGSTTTTFGLYPPLAIYGGLDCTFENIMCSGGDFGFYLVDSSYCHVIGYRTYMNFSCGGGLRITGGGDHVFIKTHIYACGLGVSSGVGVGVLLEASSNPYPNTAPANITFNALTFEGHTTSPQLDIEAGAELTVTNISIASPSAGSAPNQVGINIAAGVSGVRFINGQLDDCSGLAGCLSVQILSTSMLPASDIVFDGVAQILQNGTVNQNIQVSQYAQRVRLDLIKTNLSYVASGAITLATGMVGALNAVMGSASAGGYDIFRTATGQVVTTLTDGYDGQILTLLGPASGTASVSSIVGGNIHLSSSSYTLGSSTSTIRLVYDATNSLWLELSRS